MGYIIVILLSIGYFFLIPNWAWEVDIPTLFEMTDKTTNNAKIENFLKNYNLIDKTTADFASDLIGKVFVFTLIFFIMGCIIVHQIRKRKKIEKQKENIKNNLNVEKSKIEEQKQNEIKDLKYDYELRLKEKDVEIAYLRAEQLTPQKTTKKQTSENKDKNNNEEKE